jgi:anti-sigma regulatory factor (Ser/Thr protein kinase)
MNAHAYQSLPQPPYGMADAAERRNGVGPFSHTAQRPVRPTPPPLPQPQRYPLVSTLTPLGALPTAPGVARGHVKDTLTTWDMASYIEVAELLISEMVTNAAEASTDKQGYPIYVNGRMPLIVVRLVATGNSVVLEVWDYMPTLPEVKNPDDLAERGRGMFLVETLASRWAWRTTPEWPGKCVWAELRAST